MERHMTRSRSVGKLYSAWKEPELNRLLDELERTKSSLSLIYVMYCQSRNMRESEKRDAALLMQADLLSTYRHEQFYLQTGIGFGPSSQPPNSSLQRGTDPRNHSDIHETNQVFSAETTSSEVRAIVRRPKKLSRSWKARIQLPSWLVERAWDTVLSRQDGLFTLQIRPVNIRPYDTIEFDYLEKGNLTAVKALLRTGDLTVWDCDPRGGSLLEYASRSGNTQLCEMLLQEAPHLQEDAILDLALTEQLNHGYHGESLESLYRLFIDCYGMTADLSSAQRRPSLLKSSQVDSKERFDDTWCLLGPCLDVILRNQTHPWANMPFVDRFETAMACPGWPPEKFISCVQRDAEDHQIVTQRDGRGRTALHWVAAQLGYWCLTRLSRDHSYKGQLREQRRNDCAQLITQLLGMGADANALDHDGRSPLSYLLRRPESRMFWADFADIEDLGAAVEVWGTALRDAGLSMRNYAAAETSTWLHETLIFETEVWSPSGSDETLGYLLDRIYIAEESSRLDLMMRSTRMVTIWEQRPPPGHFLDASAVPCQVSWNVGDSHNGEPFFVPIRKVRLRGQTLVALSSLLSSRHDDESLTSMQGFQDDNRGVAYLLHTCHDAAKLERRAKNRRRSCSVPRRFQQSSVHESRIRVIAVPWLPPLHYCVGDQTRMFTDHWRAWRTATEHNAECMKSSTVDWARLLQNRRWSHGSWEAELLKARDKHAVVERFAKRFWDSEQSDIGRRWEREKERRELDVVIEECRTGRARS